MTKQDGNSAAIVSALRAAGATVRFIEFSHGIAGCPDILVGIAGRMYLLELKVKRGRLSPAQQKFHSEWTGPPIAVVRTIVEAFEAVGMPVPF